MATTQNTVITITAISPAGIRFRVLGAVERRPKVAMRTMTMTATRAAIGMSETTGPNAGPEA